jgi:hypothetical protein
MFAHKDLYHYRESLYLLKVLILNAFLMMFCLEVLMNSSSTRLLSFMSWLSRNRIESSSADFYLTIFLRQTPIVGIFCSAQL